MGLFDRLFGGNKEEKQVEEVVEAVEVVSEATSESQSERMMASSSASESQSETRSETQMASQSAVYSMTASESIAARLSEMQGSAKAEPKLAEPVSVVETPAPEPEQTIEAKYEASLKKTRSSFGERFNAFLANFRSVDEDFFEDLEETLIMSDVGVELAMAITEELRGEARLAKAKSQDALRALIVEKIVDKFDEEQLPSELNLQEGLSIFLFVGVNGVGKTTTIGKLASRYKKEGKKVLLAAADTFRAGAIDQLVEWGNRSAAEVVTKPAGSDPASVVFDAVQKAKAEGYDVLLVDTAGRLQNKDNLMKELEKIGKIIKREVPEAPHDTILALDATTGQNAIQQAKEFSAVTPITGIALTKLDGSAKGGIVLSIVQSLKIPVKLVGLGEKIEDLTDFDEEYFVKGLFKELL
ncbi:signal recognition particle-docking protein FtsY [Lactococcus termiticola]|uniref:Signal recognition particle receptor FtsY n=1 Tax=Lactococcus termiticola TaxID=2169526 RepID=A0A2R5HIV4_9LACT|nr:signal recognition particle-docking protein FtsY [Lactococcus termiticola]GBG96338.1 cell division protein FtsY [Lactococcus termiticola]